MTATFIASILDSQNKQLNALLNLCESEIEKWFLVKVLNYISIRPYEYSYSFLCEPTETELVNGKEYLKTERGYYSDANWGVNITGLKIDNKIKGTFYHVFPQKEIFIDKYFSGKKYRLYFSIEKYSMKNTDQVLKFYCIECDGHEFHSTKEQISSDNSRLRQMLLLQNFITLRYSGSELFKWDKEEIGLFLFNL